MHVRRHKTAIGFCLSAVAALSLAVTPVSASFRQTWSAIGTVGIADAANEAVLTRSDTGSVFIKSSVASATAHLRYPVVPVGDMTQTTEEVGGAFGLRVLMRDTGSTARVVVSLKSVNVYTGAITTYATLDSDKEPESGTGTQYFKAERPLSNPDGTLMSSFFTYSEAYYVDVLMTKTASSGNPGVKIVQVYNLNS